jgi:hypothetical protein
MSAVLEELARDLPALLAKLAANQEQARMSAFVTALATLAEFKTTQSFADGTTSPIVLRSKGDALLIGEVRVAARDKPTDDEPAKPLKRCLANFKKMRFPAAALLLVVNDAAAAKAWRDALVRWADDERLKVGAFAITQHDDKTWVILGNVAKP